VATVATPRRTQAERTAATTGALLAAARARFAADGYVAATLNAIAADAGVTKGALYHHFEGKEELFAAVYDREQERLAELTAGSSVADVCLAYLDALREPGTRRIMLVDAPLALSVTTLRSSPFVTLAERALNGYPGDAFALAQLLHGAVREAALSGSLGADAELRTLLAGLNADA
jgi:AcrR family transcriptional regulator